MAEQNEVIDVFSFSASEIDAFNDNGGASYEKFNPQPEEGKEYIFRMRVVTNIKAPKQTLIGKKMYWLTDERGGFPFNSPSTFKGFCPVSVRYWALEEKNSKDANMHALSKQLRIQKVYGAIVQIKTDVKNPDNVGKMFPYRLPVELYKFIDGKTNLSEEALKAGKKAKELFNLLKAFDIVVTVTKGDDGRKYAMELHDEQTSIMVNGNENLEDTPENRKAIVELFNSQVDFDINDLYGYKEADAQTKSRVKRLLITKYHAADDFWPEVGWTAQLPNQQNVAQPATNVASIIAEQQGSGPASPASPAAPASPASPAATASPNVAAPAAEKPAENVAAPAAEKPAENVAAPAAEKTAENVAAPENVAAKASEMIDAATFNADAIVNEINQAK